MDMERAAARHERLVAARNKASARLGDATGAAKKALEARVNDLANEIEWCEAVCKHGGDPIASDGGTVIGVPTGKLRTEGR